MKYILPALLLLSILMPAIAQLSDPDLDKIRLIIKEEIDPVKKDVAVMQGKLEGINKRVDDLQNHVDKRIDDLQNHVDKRFNHVDKRFEDVSGKINIVIYIVCALVALIAIAIIPQYIFLFRSNKTAEQDRKIEVLTEKIETLEKQRIVS